MTANQSTVKSDMATVDYSSFQPTKPHCLLSNCLSYPKKRKKLRGRAFFPRLCKEVMRSDQMRTKPVCPPYSTPRALTDRKTLLVSIGVLPLQTTYRWQLRLVNYQGFMFGTIGSESLQQSTHPMGLQSLHSVDGEAAESHTVVHKLYIRFQKVTVSMSSHKSSKE